MRDAAFNNCDFAMVMSKHEGPRILTTGQIAKMCSVAARTVAKWVDTGLLKGHRVPGSRDRRVKWIDLVEFAAKHGMPVDESKLLPEQTEAK